jgi:hypothetical protein
VYLCDVLHYDERLPVEEVQLRRYVHYDELLDLVLRDMVEEVALSALLLYNFIFLFRIILLLLLHFYGNKRRFTLTE